MNRLLQSPQQLSLLLKTTRKARGWSQAEVAARLGISQNRFSELEADASGLSVDRLLELAKLLGLELFVQKADSPASRDAPGAPGAADAAW